MIQFYFLSILTNIIGGIALSGGFFEKKVQGFKGLQDFFGNKAGLRVTVGIVAVVTGVLKLLSVSKGDVPVIGDFLPAFSGLIVGTALLYERYKEKSSLPEESSVTLIDRLVIKNKTIIGGCAIGIGVLHFFLNQIIFF